MRDDLDDAETEWTCKSQAAAPKDWLVSADTRLTLARLRSD